MNTKRKPVIGEKLFLVSNLDPGRRFAPHGVNVAVSRVGRKFFEVTPEGGGKHNAKEFSIDQWKLRGDFSCGVDLFESEQVFKDRQEARRIADTIARKFSDWSERYKYSLQTLRMVEIILDLETKAPELAGTFPVVLNFRTEADRDELVSAVQALKPGMIARSL